MGPFLLDSTNRINDLKTFTDAAARAMIGSLIQYRFPLPGKVYAARTGRVVTGQNLLGCRRA